MIGLLADGGIQESDVRTLIAVAGLLITVVGFCRVPLLLSQEFSDDEEAVKKPMAFAVAMTVDFDKFKADEWRGFRALCLAFRLKEFLDRFKLIVDPKFGTGVFLFLFGIALVFYVGLRLQQSGTVAQGLVVGAFALLTAIWVIVIEWGKALKRATTRLRVT